MVQKSTVILNLHVQYDLVLYIIVASACIKYYGTQYCSLVKILISTRVELHDSVQVLSVN